MQALYNRSKWEKKQLSFDEIMSSLRSVATTTYSRVFIIVDALDECQVSDNGRTKFLEAILNLQAECKTSIHIFATSRFILKLGKDLRMPSSGRLLHTQKTYADTSTVTSKGSLGVYDKV